MASDTQWSDPGWATVHVPSWLYGKKPMRFFQDGDLVVRATSDRGTFLVRTAESYNKVRPSLIRSLSFDDAKRSGPQSFEGLRDMTMDGVESSEPDLQVSTYLDELHDQSGDLAVLTHFYQLSVMTAPKPNLPEQARTALRSIRECTVEGREQAFPHAEVFALRRSESLLHRIKAISVLLRLEHDPRLRELGPTALPTNGESEIFASSSDLHMGFYMLDTYVAPLLGALSPGVWGFVAFRGHGPIIFSFGSQVSGTNGRPMDLIGTLPKRGPDEPVEFTQLSRGAGQSAGRWWAEKLNGLFAVISDPAVFIDRAGEHRALAQLQAILTVEQLFLRVASIQSNYNDTNARRVLLFTVLDTLDSLTGRSIETHCNVEFARRTLVGLEADMEFSAASILLPGARRAIEGLEATQSGFFLRDDHDRIVIDPDSGKSLSLCEAVATYLKLLRDATHGHGGNRARQKALAEQLLTRHNGQVPHDVAQLGYLYLLDVLAHPDRLRRILVRESLGVPDRAGAK